ncbi:MAG: hypothetical protein J0I34_16765 [Pseudonocardia sp.]|uniref:hypothetical protein n=1 Tax=unclassified Pseudonocardia TaxID=2619320 RepID=UPI0008694CBC|nr:MULTISPECIES: hypothetical protein [unclassified Pseudonocardia]MBN9110419.1 hypothetical protein [Pseudonocardia sp.]ODU19763.1 MAG: hypothetical protein ABS80_18980 [Pseudonocardia sp. SCN 72-51]ODV03509.1 MAG: hypothetical protein ABT15_23005 [Pseudonocardia sp. SCN 73-27]
MISAVAVLPQPPLLVPELAGAAAAETADVRDAVLDAAAGLAARAPRWVAVGADAGGRRTVASHAAGTFAGFGVDVRVALDTSASPYSAVDPDLPLPLLVAGWAAASTGAAVTVRGELVAPDLPTADCLALGRALASELASEEDAVGLLVVGDGAATHTEKAPGHLDPRAAAFDTGVAAALATADTDALAALDPALAAELWVAGRAPWQVLAGAAEGLRWDAELLCSVAPFGVAYHVAFWTPR